MPTLTEKIKSIDLAGVIEAAGVKLHTSGTRRVGKCPFHNETRGSFFVFKDNFHCFGCGEHGDAVDFVQRLHDCSFNEALAFLGIGRDQDRAAIRRAVRESKQRRRAKKLKIQRERDLVNTLAILIRSTYKVMSLWKTVDDFENSGDILHQLLIWEYHHKILSTGTRNQKDQLLFKLKDMATVSRRYLWSGEFDYKNWLKNTGGDYDIQQSSKGNQAVERKMGGRKPGRQNSRAA